MGNTQSIIRKSVKCGVWMPEEYEDRGSCQGRMNDEIKERIAVMSAKMSEEVKCETWQMYDTGLLHPDTEDLKQLEIFVKNAISI